MKEFMIDFKVNKSFKVDNSRNTGIIKRINSINLESEKVSFEKSKRNVLSMEMKREKSFTQYHTLSSKKVQKEKKNIDIKKSK
jgi:hypothetical protein